MKRIVIILILAMSCAASSYAQHYIGVKGGTGVSYGRFYPKRDQRTVTGVHSVAFAWKYYNSYKYLSGVNKYAGGVSVEIEYMQRAFKYLDPYTVSDAMFRDTTFYRRDVNTIAVPIMCQPHFKFGRNNGVRVFMNAGIVITYNIDSKEYRYTKDNQLVSSNNYEMNILRDRRLGYGLAGGPGLNVAFGRWELTLEGRYYFDLADVLRTRNDYPSNPFIRTQIDKISVYFGVFYRLGNNDKYGIKPRVRQTSRKQSRMERRAAMGIVPPENVPDENIPPEVTPVETVPNENAPEETIPEGDPPAEE